MKIIFVTTTLPLLIGTLIGLVIFMVAEFFEK